MFNRLCSEAIERGDSGWLFATLTRLEQEQPETRVAEGPYLLSYHLQAAAALGRLDTDFVERSAARLSAPNDQFWQVHDDATDNIHRPTVDFMRAASEERDVPLGRAHLARRSIESCHLQPYEGAGLMDTQDLLQMTPRNDRNQLDETGSFTSSRPHRRAAFHPVAPMAGVP